MSRDIEKTVAIPHLTLEKFNIQCEIKFWRGLKSRLKSKADDKVHRSSTRSCVEQRLMPGKHIEARIIFRFLVLEMLLMFFIYHIGAWLQCFLYHEFPMHCFFLKILCN